MEPIIYLFDTKTGELLGTKKARPSPLGDGYMLPPPNSSNATLIAPPEPEDGKACCFDKATQEWKQIEDHRQQEVFNANGSRAREKIPLGPLPLGLTTKPRPDKFHKLIDNDWIEDVETKSVLEKADREFKEKQEKLDILLGEFKALKDVLIEEEPTRQGKLTAKLAKRTASGESG